MKRLLYLAAALLLLSASFSCRAEEDQRVYVLGNFYFGMPVSEVRAMDKTGAALEEADEDREVRLLSLLSDQFAVSLWFDGLEEDAPLIEMDFAFFTAPDSVARDGNRLQIKTAWHTVNLVYSYVERLCKKTFGQGKSAAEDALPFSSLLFPEGDFSRLRVYSLSDGGKTDMIVHLIANGEYSVNYLVCRQAEQ